MSRDFFDIDAYNNGDNKRNNRKNSAKENEDSRFDKPDLDNKSTPRIFSKDNNKGPDLYNPESYDSESAKKNIRELNITNSNRTNRSAIRKIDFNEEVNKRGYNQESNSKAKTNSKSRSSDSAKLNGADPDSSKNQKEEKRNRANKKRISKMESIESAASIYRLDKSKTNDSEKVKKGQAPRTYSQRSSGLYESKLHSKETAKRPELINLSKKEDSTASKQANTRNNLLYISLVVIVAFFIALFNVLNAQSEVIQVNYDNAAIESRTDNLAKENAERLERIARNRDLEEIAIAAQNLGFVYPNTQQMQLVEQDDDDIVILYNEDSNALGVTTDEVDLEEVYDRIEAYVLSGENQASEEELINSTNEDDGTVESETDSSETNESNIDASDENINEGDE